MFKVGDRVKDFIKNREGIITKIDETTTLPIQVLFDDDRTLYYYSKKGLFSNNDVIQRLYPVNTKVEIKVTKVVYKYKVAYSRYLSRNKKEREQETIEHITVTDLYYESIEDYLDRRCTKADDYIYLKLIEETKKEFIDE